MPKLDFFAITATIKTRDYLQSLGWRPNMHGRYWLYGPCPVCQRQGRREHTLSVSRQSYGWHCHRCRKGGGVLQLAMHVTGLPIYPAALALCDQMHLTPPVISTAGYARKRRQTYERQ